MGNHELYKRRRTPDSIEVQQIKAEVNEEKQRKQLEKQFGKQKQDPVDAEREKIELQERLKKFEDQYRVAQSKGELSRIISTPPNLMVQTDEPEGETQHYVHLEVIHENEARALEYESQADKANRLRNRLAVSIYYGYALLLNYCVAPDSCFCFTCYYA